MVAKRPQDRPEWAEVLKILSDPAMEPAATRHPAIVEAISSALAKHQEQEKQNLVGSESKGDRKAASALQPFLQGTT